MKKFFRWMTPVILILIVSMFAFSGCSRISPKASEEKKKVEQPADSENMSGAYTKQQSLTAEEQELFDKVMKTVDNGKTYEAVSVATQVVAGTNYRYEVTITEDGQKTDGYVTIFQPLPGQGDAEFVGEE